MLWMTLCVLQCVMHMCAHSLHLQVRQSVAIVLEDLASKEGLRHRAPDLF